MPDVTSAVPADSRDAARSVAQSASYRSLTCLARTQISPVRSGQATSGPSAIPDADNGLTRTSTPGSGLPTHTPSPSPAASISAAVTSVTGKTSVIPYGVCAAAPGSTSCNECSKDAGTGAPADMSSRILPRAARCRVDTPPRGGGHAAQRCRRGEHDGRVDRCCGVGQGRCGERPGAVTSMSGTEDRCPAPARGGRTERTQRPVGHPASGRTSIRPAPVALGPGDGCRRHPWRDRWHPR